MQKSFYKSLKFIIILLLILSAIDLFISAGLKKIRQGILVNSTKYAIKIACRKLLYLVRANAYKIFV